MKRLFLLLVALFLVATLQAQVMCYEYEYSHTKITKSPLSSKYKYTVEPSYQGKKLYLAIEKRGQSCKAIYSATSDGQYWPQNLLCSDKRTFTYQGRSYDICTDGEMRYTVGIGGSLYNRYYHSKRVFKAYNKATLIYESAPHLPKFKSDSSRYKNFREWFMQEMPAQEVFNAVHSITIIIEKDGSVTTEEIDTYVFHDEQLTRQVSEVLARSPKWIPAYDKDGKTPLRYRMKMYDLPLRKTEARLAREAQEAKERAEQKAKEEAEREAYLRTPEGKARERQKIEDLCAQWGVGAFDRVICQSRGGAKLGGITLEELNARIRSASRPLVVITEYPACHPSTYLMQDLKTLLEAYEDQYDLYIVHLIPAVEAYQKALGIRSGTPSVLFVYNGYGAYEERVGYSRSEQQKFVAWFDQMMKKAAF